MLIRVPLLRDRNRCYFGEKTFSAGASAPVFPRSDSSAARIIRTWGSDPIGDAQGYVWVSAADVIGETEVVCTAVV